MLDNLYKNIGGKIKNWAKWIFIIEAIGAIIIGFVLLGIDEDFILYGLLTLVCGPIVAYIGSWILYAFGELVEKTADNENNTRQILKIINENPANYITEESEGKVKSIIASETSNEEKENWTDTTTFSTTEKGTIICSQCNFEQPGNRICCWHCGAKFENAKRKAEEKIKREAKERAKWQEENKTQNNELSDDDFIDIACPKCGEMLSFLKNETKGICLECGAEFEI